ncbi:glutaminase [Gulosibacter sp. 10]|uniref:glutaminase n=1 Tax=Gulosibacter sp. 10 TaxID=1255570 RepID=UPI00097F08B7|nr:glutaminase [Gulosibacter sp. 10]SJM58106.1 Glutaminase [Gulosibacter sp. 10]
MESPVPGYLADVLDSSAAFADGAVADYIPELAGVDPDRAAIALATVDGTVYAQGDADAVFTIQSMSKPFTYALALSDLGIDGVGEKVGVEPSGEAFNEISLEPDTGRPRNPMINAGAISTHGLVAGADAADRLRRILDFYSAFADRPLELDDAVAESELEEGHRNLAFGHLLRSVGNIEGDPVAVVEGYIRQCAAKVAVADLALMAATLANGGVQPRTGRRLLDQRIVRHVLSVMMSCGMYDAAGDWLTTVGIPSKSGVSGGIVGVLPGQVGLAVFSPRLDRHGNSVRGVKMMERLSEDMGMHVMEAARPARSAIRDVHRVDYRGEEATVYELHGDLVFSSTESLIRRLVEDPPATRRVIFDLDRVDEIEDVARRMAVSAGRSLLDDGHALTITDRNGVLGETDLPRETDA